MPVQSYIQKFREEFEYHIKHKRCMTGTKAGVFAQVDELVGAGR